MASTSKSSAKNTSHSNIKKLNRLSLEKSPYLLQHATNPVEWYPWGDEALERAKKEDKMIFLSVGYSTCHWCHVMEKESFENEDIARIMNENFVNIKVDREERPDIDRIYMTFVQARVIEIIELIVAFRMQSQQIDNIYISYLYNWYFLDVVKKFNIYYKCIKHKNIEFIKHITYNYMKHIIICTNYTDRNIYLYLTGKVGPWWLANECFPIAGFNACDGRNIFPAR